MEKKKKFKIWLTVLMAVSFCIVFSIEFYHRIVVEAADNVIIIDGDRTPDTYQLRRKNIPAYVENIQGGTSVIWSTSDKAVFVINNSNQESVTTGSNITIGAVGTGTATLTAAFTDTAGVNQTLTREISVPSAILEDPAYFGFVRNDDTRQSAMVLEAGQTGKLELLFQAQGNSITWTSSDVDVISMSKTADDTVKNNTGDFTATGSGKTTINVNYLIDGQTKSSSIDVYVGPKPSTIDGLITDKAYLKKGDIIYTGAKITSHNATISDKIYWILTDKENKVLETSATASKKYLSTTPYSAHIDVIGRAGYYNLHILTAGVYKEGDTIGNLTSINGIVKKTIELQILPEPASSSSPISLQVGDSYDVAEIFNMTQEDFDAYFDCTLDVTKISILKGVVSADDAGAATLSIKLKDGMKEEFAKFLHADPVLPYTLEYNIYKGFTLDRAEASIYVGGTLKLNTVYGESKGTVSWKSEDKNFVTVEGFDTSAIITGVKSTGDKTVKVTASMTLVDGRTLTASCAVKVGITASKITLSETDLTLRMGATSTITAKFQPSTVTSAKLKWLVTDDTIVDVSENSEKSVVVTGKKAGTTILSVVNTDNYIAAYCTIRVSSAIDGISLNYTEKTMTMSQEVLRLRATYTPSNATLNTLKWSTSDAKIATVDSDGLVSFKAPGTVLITVQPEWNEAFVMAQCKVTIIASPTAFAFDKTSITLEAGKTEVIKPVLTAPNATTTIKWATMDTKVATVNNGTVTAVSAGQTHIIATTSEGFVANCLVTVTQKASGITLSTYTLNLAVGESEKVTATPNPTSSSEKTFTWTSKESNIASVSNNGTVTAVAAGSTVIFVKTKSGDMAYLYVTVYDKAKGMTLNYDNKELAKGKTFKLKPVFTPANATNLNVTWKSLNTGIATVSTKGVVKGIKGGAAIITCTAEDGGYLATCLVKVVEPVTSIKLNYKSLKLGVGKSATLKATVTSNASSNGKVKWSTSNSKIATVSSSGKVKGKKYGTVTITAKATDGTGKKATCKVRVVRQVTGMSMNKSVMTLTVNDTRALKVKVKPSNATYKTAKWTSSNKEVAIVDSKGNVTGLSVGSCTIKASAKDNSKKSVSCYVSVIDPVPISSILISAKNLVMIKGQSQVLSYTITPSNHTDKLSFASDNKAVATISSSGMIYARRTGAATITLTSGSGKQSTVSVTVIGLNKTNISLEQYDTETLTVDGASTGVTWYSDNPSIASVAAGKIVGRKAGTTTIHARVSGVILSCRVRVTSIS